MDNVTLKQILESPFDLHEWQRVLREVFDATRVLQNPDDSLTNRLTDKDRELASRAAEIGSLETSDGMLVGLYQVDLTDKPRIWQNRVGLRSLLRSVYKHDVDAALVVFVQGDKWRLSLISEIRVLNDNGEWTRQETAAKRFTYLLGPGETVRTPVDRLENYQGSDRTLANLIDTFSVEPLNKSFFREYKTVFDDILSGVQSEFKEADDARLFTQRLLNRLMFLYFIQKKGWMNYLGDLNYLRRVFNEAVARKENFYRDRLYWIFFYGLSHHAESIEVKDDPYLQERRGHVEYLNGGLFEMEPDGTDEKGKINIDNDRFKEILELFERYNFTIDESTPFEIQVAVDPEMLGKVFEELVTGRHSSGSYYTPRTVVSFMCREALKHALADKDSEDAIAKLVDENDGKSVQHPEEILARLKELKVCDPACGSGAYLLGMLQELLHVREALFASTEIAKDAQYDWKREIIENNIYGVDLDKFATQIAALRLWLSLAIESDEPHALPNLKYKIGSGDSLLAPIESVGQGDLTRRALIEQFRARKREYTDADGHFEKAAAEAEIERLRVEIAQMFNHLPRVPKPSEIVLAEAGVQPLKEKIDRLVGLGDKGQAEKFQKQLDELLAHTSKLKASVVVRSYDTGSIFDWSVEFAEVFEDGGFDIVLANPPYVRQEEIKPKEYKEKLLTTFSASMTGKSDLYVPFYQRGMELLRNGGTHVFVCSNSWLDVGYGAKLQKYLLDHGHIASVYDSAVERQFSSASINTIISFIHKQTPADGDVSSFVSLRAPFNEAIADAAKRRVVTRTRRDLIESGSDETHKYEGDKWGGKYLRAPDIYFTILEKGKGKLVRLGDIAEVRFGIKTGANEFFYLSEEDQARWQIEEEFLRPILFSLKEIRSINDNLDAVRNKIFFCNLPREKLPPNARRYIEWGEIDSEWIDEKTGLSNPPYLRPSVRGRRNWYGVGSYWEPAPFVFPAKVGERMVVLNNHRKVLEDKKLYGVTPKNGSNVFWAAVLNSTLTRFLMDLTCRQLTGAQAIADIDVRVVEDLMIPAHQNLPDEALSSALIELGDREIMSKVTDEYSMADRRELDNIIFDALGLTTGERDAVYEAVIDLVRKRLQRAQTITN